MIGAIAGDIIGSAYEWHNIKSKEFDLFSPRSKFTDDTVLTVAVADCILNNRDYAKTFKEYGRRYPHAGYGGSFNTWLHSDSLAPYNSYGNGSAMRVSPVGFAFDNLDKVSSEAKRSAEVTHDHPEGIKGAQATAAAIFLARTGKDKNEIRDYIEATFEYDLSPTLAEIQPGYNFDVTCQGSVPQAIIAFLESANYEDAIRNAISIGGDSDTIACITGGIAHAFYKSIPATIIAETLKRLDKDLIIIVNQFNGRYDC